MHEGYCENGPGADRSGAVGAIYQVRVRMRIMKLSKPSSATCIHA
jgi:hypothetical protein